MMSVIHSLSSHYEGDCREIMECKRKCAGKEICHRIDWRLQIVCGMNQCAIILQITMHSD